MSLPVSPHYSSPRRSLGEIQHICVARHMDTLIERATQPEGAKILRVSPATVDTTNTAKETSENDNVANSPFNIC
jgi:hypothetical protein